MNKLAKKMANREGFTLVELIVVIAILGILAGIAIPVYSGYISKANEAADMQILDSVKTAAVFAAVDANPEATVTEITFAFGQTDADKTNVTVKTDKDTTGTVYDIDEYVGNKIASKAGNVSATWTVADGWELSKTAG